MKRCVNKKSVHTPFYGLRITEAECRFFCILLLSILATENTALLQMSLAQVEHTDTGLTDASADGVGQFFFQHSLLEGQFGPVFAAGFFQLFRQ